MDQWAEEFQVHNVSLNNLILRKFSYLWRGIFIQTNEGLEADLIIKDVNFEKIVHQVSQVLLIRPTNVTLEIKN